MAFVIVVACCLLKHCEGSASRGTAVQLTLVTIASFLGLAGLSYPH